MSGNNAVNGANGSSGSGGASGASANGAFSELYAEEDTTGKIMTMGENGQMVEYLGPSVDEVEEQAPESLDLDLKSGGQKVWLVKLPKRLSNRWIDDMSKIEGKELGKLRIKNGNGDDVKLVLENIAGVTEDLPLQYRIMMNKRIIENEFIFTEQNLKNFRSERTEVSRAPDQPRLRDLDEDKFDQKAEARKRRFRRMRERKYGDGQQQKPRYIPFVKTIPKKTALVGTVYHECQVLPLMTDKNYIKQLRKDLKPKARASATLLQEAPGLIQSNTGPSITKGNTSQFLRQDKHKAKSDGRAIRMPQKDLLDLLFRLFDEYDYWTMKGLRERTKQPETYLKESLEKVAVLIKRGPYALKYALKPEYKALRDAEKAKLASAAADDGREDAGNSDSDLEMEDVV